MDLIKSETSTGNSHVGNGWKMVYRERHQKNNPAFREAKGGVSDIIVPNENVFCALMFASDEEADSNSAGAARNKNLKADKTRKRIVSLPEVAANIDPSHIADFLAKETMPEFELFRFYISLEKAFSAVSFPWVKMFKESPLSKLIDVPLSHIPAPVYETSVDWIKKRSITTLWKFISWVSDRILIDLEAQQGGANSGKKGSQHSSESEVAAFVALAMVLRCRPDALTIVLPMLRGRPRCLGEDKLPVIVWMMAQASQGDLPVGLCSWAHNLLPLVGNKKCCSPRSMDLILQLVENILSNPKARTILVNRAVREGEGLIPLPSFEILVRLTFPAPSARVKATERFEAIYPLLKDVALTTGINTIEQIFTLSLKLAGEGNPVLAKEATAIAIWSLTKNADCFNIWDNLYTVNLEASVAVLKKLVDEWKDHSLKLSSSLSDTVNRTMNSFRLNNEKAITDGGANCSLYKEADKSCKVISGRLHRGSGRLEGFTASATYVLVAAGATAGAAVGAAATALVLYFQ